MQELFLAIGCLGLLFVWIYLNRREKEAINEGLDDEEKQFYKSQQKTIWQMIRGK